MQTRDLEMLLHLDKVKSLINEVQDLGPVITWFLETHCDEYSESGAVLQSEFVRFLKHLYWKLDRAICCRSNHGGGSHERI